VRTGVARFEAQARPCRAGDAAQSPARRQENRSWRYPSSVGVCVGMDESMPATRRDLWARFMASALMEIRLSHETDESASPERQQAPTRGYCGPGD
jgi:hypothetical protein